MLSERTATFAALVKELAGAIGRSPPAIAAKIIDVLFPKSRDVTEEEGADKMFRRGVVDEVKRVLKTRPDDEGPRDFADIEPTFRPIARRLGNSSYYVESLHSFASVRELVDAPELLDDARKFMRRKGDECHAEADVLDELYAAVVAAR